MDARPPEFITPIGIEYDAVPAVRHDVCVSKVVVANQNHPMAESVAFPLSDSGESKCAIHCGDREVFDLDARGELEDVYSLSRCGNKLRPVKAVAAEGPFGKKTLLNDPHVK